MSDRQSVQMREGSFVPGISRNRLQDGSVGLSRLKGMQIVNGGQTTSSVCFSARDNKGLDLSHMMIPAKIVILRGEDEAARELLVSRISQYANTQNPVKSSDLSANRPFHVQLENLANDTWCPDGVGRWFCQRAAGGYAVTMLREGRTPAQKRRVLRTIPAARKLTKNDVARYHGSWRGLPTQVAPDGEKNFGAFMAAIDDDPNLVPNPLDVAGFKELIVKVILFKSIEKQIKTKEAKAIFRQGYVNIASPTIAMFATRYGGQINLSQVWQRQEPSGPLARLLWDRAVIINRVSERAGAGARYSELAKRARTWALVREADYRVPSSFIPELRGNSETHPSRFCS